VCVHACVCVCLCVYLCVHQLCLYVCACRPILIVAMETECCQRSPDSKRASVSLCDSLSSSLSLLISLSLRLFSSSWRLTKVLSGLHSPSLSGFLPLPPLRCVSSCLLSSLPPLATLPAECCAIDSTQGPVIRADEPPAISFPWLFCHLPLYPSLNLLLSRCLPVLLAVSVAGRLLFFVFLCVFLCAFHLVKDM